MAGRTLTADGAVEVWPGARVRPGVRTTLLLGPILLAIVAGFFLVQTDPDYWWHVRTGQYIYDTRTIPRVDIYSHTAAGWPWTSHEWLTELLLYLVERRFGYVGNIVLFGLGVALTALAIYATCRRRGLGEPGAALLVVWCLAMLLPMLNVRPQLVTMLLLAVCALLLTQYKQGCRRAIWALPPLLALWVNLHGGYVIGLVLLGLTIAGEAIARARRQEAAPLAPLLTVTALSTLALLLNPHGLEALRYPLTYVGAGNASMQYVQEWQSPNFHQPLFLTFAASLLLALVLGLGRRPLGATEVLWALVFALMALRSMRHVALYAIVVTPLVGARLQSEIPYLRRSLLAWRRSVLLGLLALLWLLPALAVLGPMAGPEQRSRLQRGPEPGANGYPVGAVEYLRRHDLGGNLLNEYAWGGYLIYQLYPRQRVFIDGRADPYGDALVIRFRNVTLLRPHWRQTLDEYDVRLVLVAKESPLAVALRDDRGWREVYTGAVEGLFVRQTASAAGDRGK